ncbi:MAG: hypothetical protein B7Y90_16145 [Alphaproteobacteria bacterium 32-64-14]|nr:MAG: hypothetical protein B7Y90_16145 [Alphaproteobacteria bacterium 32-64-14]
MTIITGGARRPERESLSAMPHTLSGKFTHDAATRRALQQMTRAVARGDLAAAERWLSAAERCLALAERAAGLAALRPHPHRAHAPTPWRPPPPPPAPPIKYNPSDPRETAQLQAILAARAAALRAKLGVIAPEDRPPRHRTAPTPRPPPGG